MAVVVSGPLFDGLAEEAMNAYTEHLKGHLAQAVTDRIHARLGEVIKHPTGRYESQIHTEHQADDLVVTDQPIVYGPWLEGVGSRNSPVTRFPGYHTFRTVTRQIQPEIRDIAERDIERYVAEAN